MQCLNLTLPTPAENLALDEALLESAEESNPDCEYLRLWESPQPIVVVGRSTRVAEEVDETSCREQHIPILRRSSGGAAIVAGPGCLMYALVLSYELRPELRDIGQAHQFVLGRVAGAIRRLGLPAAQAGTSDLVISNFGLRIADSQFRNPQSEIRESSARKFSGNSMRAKRTHLLYHGTLLYDFDLSLVTTCLKTPPRQPDYRAARSHQDFVTNLPVARSALENAILSVWPTASELGDWPRSRVEALVAERFSRESWNREFD